MEWERGEPTRIDWELKDDVLTLETLTERGVFHQDIQLKKLGPQKRPFWICPKCGKPRAILYFPPGATAFLCRQCHGIASYVKTMSLEERKEYWYFRFFQAMDEYLLAETPEEQRKAYRNFLRMASKAYKYEIMNLIVSDTSAMLRFIRDIWTEIAKIALNQLAEQ